MGLGPSLKSKVLSLKSWLFGLGDLPAISRAGPALHRADSRMRDRRLEAPFFFVATPRFEASGNWFQLLKAIVNQRSICVK